VQSRQLYYTQIGMNGKYITANPYFFETFGFNPEELQQMSSMASVHPDDVDACSKAAHECINNPGKAVTVVLRKPLSLGNYAHTKWEFTFINESSGDEPFIQCIGFDITGEVKGTQWLQQYKQKVNVSTELVETLLSNSVDVILVSDMNGVVTFCSPNIKAEMGYEADELIGKNGFEFVHPQDLGLALKAFEDEVTNPETSNSVDLRFRSKDGKWVWFETKGKNLLQHAMVQGLIINLNNISVRKETEEALQQSEARYRSFFENLPYPLFLIDPSGNTIANCNKSAVEKYGYSLQEFQKMKLNDLLEENTEQLQPEEKQQQLVKQKSKTGEVIIAKLEKYRLQYEDNGYHLILTQDVTDNYNRQREAQLTFDISNILMQNTSIDEVLEKALQKIRRFTGWDLIELWTPSYDHSFIKNDISAFYHQHPNADSIKEFIYKTRLQQYIKEIYGKVPAYQTKQPHWIDLNENKNSLVRATIAREAGFASALAVPILNEGSIICSIYFFAFEEKRKNDYAEKLIITLGSLIGTELEKRRRELELDRFFKISPDIMTIAGLDGRFIKVNPAFEKFIGYTQEEAKGLHPLHYVFNDDRNAVLQKMEALSQGNSIPYFENRVVTKDGKIKWIAWTATPVFEEGMVIATHRDITDQKLFEEKLRQSNERYEFATRATANEAIWDLDLKNHEITWSEVFTTLFGYSNLKEDATLGFWEAQIHQDDRKRVTSGFNQFLEQTATPNWYCEYRFKKADESYAYIVDRGYMIFDNENKPIRVVGAMEDISERKKLEEELILKERSRQKQIAQAAVNAQEKERADVGKELHDNISQMLTSTKLFLDIQRNKTPDELIERSIKNINTIITEIRNISRSLVPSSIEDLGLIASLNDLIDNIRITNIINVEFYPDADVETLINANYKLTLYRIVQEQINNIVKHASATQTQIELFHEDGHIELVITDDGKGFDINTVKKGHGLKNMRSRAELLNGSMDVITAPGKGCKLKIHIPYQ
jgi:PAS domain S-box-containing protein